MLSEVPEGWAHGPLSGFIEEIYGGGTPSKLSPEYWDGDVFWASVKDMTEFSPIQTQDKITQAGLSNSAAKMVSAGDLVLCTRMAVGVVRQFKVDVAINQDLKAIIPKEGIERGFLYWWFSHNRGTLEQLATGTTVKGLKQNSILTLELLLPPLPEQKRIAEILSSVDESIQATQSVFDQAERVKRGLMEDLLTGGLGSEAIARGEVPEGWRLSNFGAEIDFKGGNQPPKNTFAYVPTEGYVRLLQIRDFEHDDKPAYIPKDATRVRCDEKDILIARYGASLGRICRGKSGAYNVALVKLIISENLLDDFAFYWLNSKHFQVFLAQVGSRSAQAGFNKSDLAPLPLLLPPLPEQKRIAEILSSVDEFIQSQKQIIDQYQVTKKGLMDDLLTGRVRTV